MRCIFFRPIVTIVPMVQGASALGELDATKYAAVVVIPDVHGDADAAMRSIWIALKQVSGDEDIPYSTVSLALSAATPPISESLELVPPLYAHMATRPIALVQLGDLIDRGPQSRKCINIFGRIKDRIGWDVIQLFGNHEIMNFQGHHQYLNQIEWNAAASFLPGGRYYNVLASRSIGIARLGVSGDSAANTLFVHGGLEAVWLREHNLGISVSAINKFFGDNIRVTGTARIDPFADDGSPVWTRSLQDVSAEQCENVDRILRVFNVARIVVGHNPQENRQVNTVCGGKVILADVIMSRWMLNRDQLLTDPTNAKPVALIFKLGKKEGSLESIVARYGSLIDEYCETETSLFPVTPQSDPEPCTEEYARRRAKAALFLAYHRTIPRSPAAIPPRFDLPTIHQGKGHLAPIGSAHGPSASAIGVASSAAARPTADTVRIPHPPASPPAGGAGVAALHRHSRGRVLTSSTTPEGIRDSLHSPPGGGPADEVGVVSKDGFLYPKPQSTSSNAGVSLPPLSPHGHRTGP